MGAQIVRRRSEPGGACGSAAPPGGVSVPTTCRIRTGFVAASGEWVPGGLSRVQTATLCDETTPWASSFGSVHYLGCSCPAPASALRLTVGAVPLVGGVVS
jgi:hypothetical protein